MLSSVRRCQLSRVCRRPPPPSASGSPARAPRSLRLHRNTARAPRGPPCRPSVRQPSSMAPYCLRAERSVMYCTHGATPGRSTQASHACTAPRCVTTCPRGKQQPALWRSWGCSHRREPAHAVSARGAGFPSDEDPDQRFELLQQLGEPRRRLAPHYAMRRAKCKRSHSCSVLLPDHSL